MMVHDDLLPRCLPPDFRRDVKRCGRAAGASGRADVRRGGRAGGRVGGKEGCKKLENGFERFYRVAREPTRRRRAIGEFALPFGTDGRPEREETEGRKRAIARISRKIRPP